MMQKKKTPDRSYGEKLIRLFARLMFTGQKHSLTDLAKFLGCSKQTVLRLVDDITLAYDVPLRDEMRAGRKWVWIERGDHHTGQEPAALLSEGEHRTLQMCRAFTEHLLGRDTFDEIERAIEKSGHHLPAGVEDGTVFGVVRSGVIDYTKHEEVLRALLSGMEHRRVCEVKYRSLGAPAAKVFHIKPLQIFAHHETVYVHARRARTPGQPYKSPKYDPLLALHRFENVETTDVPFHRPSGYSFEKVMNQGFGVWTQKRFRVVVELEGWAASFARERTWSPDQKIDDMSGGRLRLAFWSTSEPEVMSLLLGFGACARLREPAVLVEKLRHEVMQMGRGYEATAGQAESPD